MAVRTFADDATLILRGCYAFASAACLSISLVSWQFHSRQVLLWTSFRTFSLSCIHMIYGRLHAFAFLFLILYGAQSHHNMLRLDSLTRLILFSCQFSLTAFTLVSPC
ncbi:hypothetical protein BJ912DRAFT_526637 [Pholiota molesta]|nr:hypothetical protein BJ912DRAFT_526637 [Pholiota molesta]